LFFVSILKVYDENSKIRIHSSDAWIRGSGSGFTPKCHGSGTLGLRNHFFWVKILKFFDADPGSGMETIRIRDGKKSDPG
jgi:hypothetical protein